MQVADKNQRRSQEDRVRETRNEVFEAIVSSLDERGYSATTFTTIQEHSGLSRGALTYHFASKQDMMVFACKRLLDAAIRPTNATGRQRAQASGSIVDFLMFYWRQVVNTREGRAFIEILVATRADAELDAVIGPMLLEWDKDIARASLGRFEVVNGSSEDIQLLWSMTRAFLRGLVVHAQFVETPGELEKMVRRFAQVLSEDLKLKGVER